MSTNLQRSFGDDSRPDEAGIEGSGERDVGRALNDGAAVGEEGEGVGRTFEAEEKFVEADLPMRGEAIAHGGEVDGAMMLVDLDGVAAAERDVRTAFAGKMSEDCARRRRCSPGGAGW